MNWIRRNTLFLSLILGITIWGTALLAQRLSQGPYGVFFRQTTATDTATLTTAQSIGLLVGTPTGAANYTTPTATALCNAFPSVAIVPPTSNFSVGWDIKNTSGGANTITVLGGTGVTVSGTATVAQNHMRHFIWVPGSCVAGSQAWTVFSGQDSAF